VGVPLAVCTRETVPHGACGHETIQVTPAFAPSLVTVAENCARAPTISVADVDERLIVTAGTVIVATADFVGSLTEVAVRITVSAAVCEAGEVKVVAAPLGVCVGETIPQGDTEHETLQLTPSFVGSLATVAVNCTVAPTSTVAELLESDTLIGGGVGVPGMPGVLPQPEARINRNPAINAAIADALLVPQIIHLSLCGPVFCAVTNFFFQ
jgi:hypothetical protein